MSAFVPEDMTASEAAWIAYMTLGNMHHVLSPQGREDYPGAAEQFIDTARRFLEPHLPSVG